MTDRRPLDLADLFTYHPPTPYKIGQHQRIREAGLELAHVITAGVPDGAMRTLAIRKVQEAVMWANAELACAPDRLVGPPEAEVSP